VFKHKDSHKYRWTARNQRSTIDYVMCNKKLADMASYIRVYWGPEIESGHYVLVCPICMKPRWYKKKQKKTTRDLIRGKSMPI
jgi:hypothetical protein